MPKASQVVSIWAMSILISGGLRAHGLRQAAYIAKDLKEVDDIFAMLEFEKLHFWNGIPQFSHGHKR